MGFESKAKYDIRFAEGETIIKGIQASLLPRFLAPDKAKAGGREYFERFTGKFISKNTSMGLSPLGEAYANFGIVEGAIFMLLLGLFYNFILKKIFSYAATYPTLILFLPLIFLQVVKAEVDFAVVINYLIKAIIAVALLFWFSRNFLKLRL